MSYQLLTLVPELSPPPTRGLGQTNETERVSGSCPGEMVISVYDAYLFLYAMYQIIQSKAAACLCTLKFLTSMTTPRNLLSSMRPLSVKRQRQIRWVVFLKAPSD